MGFLDKITDAVGDHAEQVEGAVDKAADLIDEKTGKKHSDQIDQAADKAKGLIEKLDDK